MILGIGSDIIDIRRFPAEERREVGRDIARLRGEPPPPEKPGGEG